MPTVAVVGAGLSGLACASTLADHGFSVTVLEKSRGAGGRMSTRRAEGGLCFDHGAQYFTVRDERFRKYVDAWMHDGLVARWDGSIVTLENGQIRDRKAGTERFVATPGMNAIGKYLAGGLDVLLNTRVAPLERVENQWSLTSTDGSKLGQFDAAVVSAPAAQTADLLGIAPSVSKLASETPMNGCWALMLAFEDRVEADFDAAFVHDSAIGWIARNSSKPERASNFDTWVVHATADWSEKYIEADHSSVQESLLAEFWKATDRTPKLPMYAKAHRWRFAIPPKPLPNACLFDRELRVVACGDWCGGPRVEGAFLSGAAAADHVIGMIGDS